jgi:hypothetical protein
LNVCDPPQLLVTVNVPVVGGFVKVTAPETLYWFEPVHPVGFAVTFVIAQGVGDTILQFVKPVPPVWLNWM